MNKFYIGALGFIMGVMLMLILSFTYLPPYVETHIIREYIAVTPNSIVTLMEDKPFYDRVIKYLEDEIGDRSIATWLADYCMYYEVNPFLAVSLMRVESEYTDRAISRPNQNGTRDYGLFQLNSSVYRRLTVRELLNPKNNIRLGVSHLAKDLKSQPSVVQALYAYNAGPSRVREGKIPATTLSYANKILSLKNEHFNKFIFRINELL